MPRLPATELINRIEDGEIVIADGAMGTELIRRGALPSETLNCNRTHPDWVKAIHHEYIEAGARLLYSNTFAPPKNRDEYADVLAGWQILCEECKDTKDKVWAALSLYPTTVCEHPELMDELLQAANAPDLVVIETCCSLAEAKIAIQEVRKRSAALIFATATASNRIQMEDGTSLNQWFVSCEANRELVGYGDNCDSLWDYTSGKGQKPRLIKPNAGMPDKDGLYSEVSIEDWTVLVKTLLVGHLLCSPK